MMYVPVRLAFTRNVFQTSVKDKTKLDTKVSDRF